MLCVYTVLALSLLSFAAAEDVKLCQDPKVTEIGDQFYASFRDAVNHSRYVGGCEDGYRETMPNYIYRYSVLANGSSYLDTVSVERDGGYRETMGNYIYRYSVVANGSCFLDTVSVERDGLEFYKLMVYSMKHGAFKDFVKDGGVGCITAIKDKITQCVQKIVGVVERPDDKYFSLWRKTLVLIIERTCRDTEALKHCTLNAIRNEGYRNCIYQQDSMMFVGTLFDYMLERCTRIVFKNDVQWLRPSLPSTNGTLITHILLGLVLALGVLAFGFWIAHDIRSPNGLWKSLNEQIAMRRQ